MPVLGPGQLGQRFPANFTGCGVARELGVLGLLTYRDLMGEPVRTYLAGMNIQY